MAKEVKEKEEISIHPFIKGILGKKEFQGDIGFGSFIPQRPGISTGSIALDLKLGGYLPRDRIIEYYGKPASCKTTGALLAMKSYIDKFGYDRILFIVDLERSITPNFVAGFGIDPNRILVIRPRTAEAGMDVVMDLISSGKCGFGIYDSVDAMESEKETDRSLSEQGMMEVAKLMSRAMRKLCKLTVDNDCGIIFINQIRAGTLYSPEIRSGGSGLLYYEHIAVRWSAAPSKEIAGVLACKPKPTKNKLSPLIPSESEFDIVPGKGVLWFRDYLSASRQLGVIEVAGRSYKLKDDNNLEIMKWGSAAEVENWMNENNYKESWAKLISNRFDLIKGSLAVDTDEVIDNQEENATNS